MDTLLEKVRKVNQYRGASTDIANILRDSLKIGSLKPGQRLPTMSEFMRNTTLGYSTINRAVAKLVDEGLLESKRGAGTFVVGSKTDSQNNVVNKGITGVFALVVPEIEGGLYNSLQQGFSDAADKSHSQVLVCSTGNKIDRQSDVMLQLLDKQVGGVALVPTSVEITPPYQIRSLQNAGIPVVLLHRKIKEVSAPSIGIPFEEVGRIFGELLIAHEHEHIAVIGSHKSEALDMYCAGICQSYQSRSWQCNLEVQCGNYPNDEWSQQVSLAIDRILDEEGRPTAIVTAFDNIAEKVYLSAMQKQISIPDELSLVSFGGLLRGSELASRITAVCVDEAETGKLAMNLLEQIREGERSINDSHSFLAGTSICQGQTLGRAFHSGI
jgi:GntR family transcriptional regulator, arabinose operon transcriptional repressor